MEKLFKALSLGSSDDADERQLLHGVLDITIRELHFENPFSSLLADLNDARGGCYVTVELPPVKVGRTASRENHRGKVVWQETLRFYCANAASEVNFYLHGHGYHGEAKVLAAEVLEKRHIDSRLRVFTKKHEHGCTLYIVLNFTPAHEDPLWGAGVGDPEAFPGLTHSFFPQHKGCRVTPYQNAHVQDDFLPPISLPDGREYRPGKYFQELHQAILDAKHFVYVAGWSMFAEIALIRSSSGQWLGESLQMLLIRRASEGVAVLVMVWDDKTNNLDGLISREGMMHTHDEDTHSSFKNTKVKVFRCPRNPSDSAFHLVDGFVFTHHQKTVVLDAPSLDPSSTKRRLIGFVGGIDLCGGRFDTPTHSLFRTLNTIHSKDFHQEALPGAQFSKGGPRQPWHDCHSKLEGAVAWDVYTNFTQRWAFQAGQELTNFLFYVTDHGNFEPPLPVVDQADRYAWNAQSFRSIDTSSLYFPSDPETVSKAGLVRGDVHLVDRSIQDAYISAIRRAKYFVYIQNQYFMGSSFAWRKDPWWEPCLPNLIPIEIALKIASKIRAGERFSAYILIPMAPNGSPSGPSVQDLLHHQRRTMEMMYTIVRKALEDSGRYGEQTTDFLHFFCLGNKEARTASEYVPPERPPPGSHYAQAQENRRFPIYVHSKVMIVDDEYLLMGSANINQRSMDGARDTEMAFGAFQPHFTLGSASNNKESPSGDVYAFRMSLWYEHLGLLNPLFDRPWELDCIRLVQQLAAENWIEYLRPGPPAADLKRHLLDYPIKVARNGHKIYTEPGDECFPDTTASILGTPIPTLPALLTA